MWVRELWAWIRVRLHGVLFSFRAGGASHQVLVCRDSSSGRSLLIVCECGKCYWTQLDPGGDEAVLQDAAEWVEQRRISRG